MTDLWVMLYYIPLFIFFIGALRLQDRDAVIITTASLVAFAFTRLITNIIDGDRYMYDFANDMFVCALLRYLLPHSKIVKCLIITYVLMILIAYVPYAAKLMSNDTRAITLEVIGKIQLLFIFGGMVNGYRLYGGRREKYNSNDIWGYFAFLRDSFNERVQQKNTKPVNERVYQDAIPQAKTFNNDAFRKNN